MEKEENVCVKTEGTEKGVMAEDTMKSIGVEKVSAVPSKFKDVDALARAYSALQSEFTRRSQRLKELERRMENLEGEGLAKASGVEKLRKNAEARKAEAELFDRFIAETERLGVEEGFASSNPEEPIEKQPLVERAEEENIEGGDALVEEKPLSDTPVQVESGVDDVARLGAGCGIQGQAQGGEGKASVVGNELSTTPSETLYAQVCRDEGVRLKIIGEYLSSLGKTSAPLMTGGAGAFTTPPFRAANITEAGNMALLYFKKPLNK